ncbi:MAG: DinB family protein [Brumimicrobium sp.]|nr:DinB family protein [Brumimicrobium sp.]
MKINIPSNEYPEYFKHYLELVDSDLQEELESQLENYVQFVRNIPKDKELFSYAPGKWTVKEIIGHNTDTERVKLNCAFRIARNDKSPIPGFDEDAYVLATNFNDRTMDDLIEEFILVRKGAIALFKSLRDEDLKQMGIASNKPISSRALFAFLVGHVRHHEIFLKEHYLK